MQDNISPENLYHQVLQERLLKESDLQLDVDILRYEKLETCSTEIAEKISKSKYDHLLFHLRVEPLFRDLKFFYRHKNKDNIVSSSITIALLGIRGLKLFHTMGNKINVVNTYSPANTSFLHKFLRGLNYTLGILSGNLRSTLSKYLLVVKKLEKLCYEKNITLIITSPASRPVSFFENFISGRIFQLILKKCEKETIMINGLGVIDKQGNYLFCNDGIRVNEAGHKRFADLIISKITG